MAGGAVTREISFINHTCYIWSGELAGGIICKINVKTLGWIWALINTPETSNSMSRCMCFEGQGLLDDIHSIANDL